VQGELKAQIKARTIKAYYAWGYARPFPGKERAARLVERWEAGKGDVPKSPQAWDDQYASGGWSFLSNLGEVAHYAVVVGYSNYVKPGGSVLDVGCGDGVLHDRFLATGYAHYTGVDISAVAIRTLTDRDLPDTDFVAMDADTFEPRRAYDVIVFNETITYFRDPDATLRRYAEFLADDGILIVSCHAESDRAHAILRTFMDQYAVLDSAVVSQGTASWRIAVFSAAALRRGSAIH
jgi:2-polyprenyl-3-methyl-5-hydroxy-6-metoxy-1,4-benzoquinol methylase